MPLYVSDFDRLKATWKGIETLSREKFTFQLKINKQNSLQLQIDIQVGACTTCKREMHLDLFLTHFSFIKDMDQDCHAYFCRVCDKMVKSLPGNEAAWYTYLCNSYQVSESALDCLDNEGIVLRI